MLGFTEELSRYAVQRATARDTAAVERCRDVVDAVLGQFLQVNGRSVVDAVLGQFLQIPGGDVASSICMAGGQRGLHHG